MGGTGSGGFRVGAGKKRAEKPGLEDVRQGAETAKELAVSVPAVKGLSKGARKHWKRLAPHAAAAHTLIDATVTDFAALCELLADLDGVRAARRRHRWSEKGLTLSREYRGLVQRAEAKLRAYKLAAVGRAMFPQLPAAAADVFDEFDEFDEPPSGATH